MGTFNMGNNRYGTCKMGYMVPIQLQEVLPGEVWKCKSRALIRMAPMVAPVFSRVKIRIHHWFVPNRLVWTNFTKFITGGEDGMDASVHPYFEINESVGTSSLMDYLQIPPSVAVGTRINAMPVRGYQLIKKLFYRDQDLEDSAPGLPTISLADGADTTTTTALQRFCWDKDIFTTARPFTMKGPDVTIPVSASSDPLVERVSNAAAWKSYNAATNTASATGHSQIDGSSLLTNSVTNTSFDPMGGLAVDADDFYIQIPDLRLGAAMARYEENRARFGGNYVDYLNYLGVNYSDKTLQRPEYLGGDQDVISFSEVLQQSPNSDDGSSEGDGVGTMTGHGISAFGKGGFKYRAEEHGFIHSVMMIAPESEYGNGVPKMYDRFTKEDYWQQELEHIGQEMVKNRELYAASASMYDPEGEFGWIDRYESYRTANNHQAVNGEMRDTLAFWNMVRLADPISPLPFVLNDTFVQCNPTNRIYQATWEDQVWYKIDNRAKKHSLVTANARPLLF